MSWESLERRFREVGVPVQVDTEREWFGVDVRRDGSRERLVLRPGKATVQVIDSDKEHEQVLLLVKETTDFGRKSVQKILCGRDESSLFTVAVWGRGKPLNSVAEAHDSLKPQEVRDAEAGEVGWRARPGRRSRKARKVVRQGEWFFIPWPHLPAELSQTRKRVRLGWGNPHTVDYLSGDERQFHTLYGRTVGNYPVFARGFVRHQDHRPIHLRCWHQVVPNTAIRVTGNYAD